MNNTVTMAKGFYARSNDGTNKFPWVQVQIKRQNPVPVPNATSYFLRYMEKGVRKIVPLGKDISKAFIAWQNHDVDMIRAKERKAPIQRDAVINDAGSVRLTIADAVQTFIDDCLDKQAKGKLQDSSVLAYTNAVTCFRDTVKVGFMDEITREVLLAHETYLHKHLQKRKYGDKKTTVGNRFRYIGTFLGYNGIKMVKSKDRPDGEGLLRFDEAPKQIKKGREGNVAPDKYSIDEINQLLAVATVDEADLIQFFLRLGVRDEEAMHANWTDIESHRKEGKTVHEFHVQNKPQYNWKTKNQSGRSIPMKDSLCERMMERKARQLPKSELIFPNTLGKPDSHLIRRLQKTALRVGLTKRLTQHKFRRTYASMMVGSSDLQTVKELLGHADISTTELYLSPDQDKASKATNTAFPGVPD